MTFHSRPLAVLFGTLAVCLAVFSQLLFLNSTPHIVASSPGDRAAVREHFAAVDTWLATGAIETLNANRPGEETIWYLQAMRSTYPHAQIDLLSIANDGPHLTAYCAVDAGPSRVGLPISTRSQVSRWQQTEIFTVESGSILQHEISVATPGLMIAHPSFDLLTTGDKIVVGRVLFDAGSVAWIRIPAPALIGVETGSIAVQGDGVTLYSEAGGDSEHTLPGVELLADQGDALVGDRAHVVLRNGRTEASSLLVTLVLDDSQPAPERETKPPYPSLQDALSENRYVPIARGITVTPLMSSPLANDGSASTVSGGWIVLPAGSSVDLVNTLTPPIIVTRSGAISIHTNQSGQTMIQNQSPNLAIAWAVLVVPTS